MKSLIAFFSSVKLAIVLLIVIVAFSILGTLIPQQRTEAEYAARYGSLAPLFQRLQFTDLYRSAWYVFLLALFALNIIVCTLTRLKAKLRKAFRPGLETEAKSLLALKNSAKFRSPLGLEDAAAAARNALSGRQYRVREKSAPSRLTLYGRKKVLGWFGSDFVHLGLLVILAGGLVSSFSVFKTHLRLKQGIAQEVPRAGYHVRLDKFETEYYPDGISVKDWKSSLTVIDGGREVKTAVIEVNHPLEYKGFTLYQSSYVEDTKSPLLVLAVRETAAPGPQSTVSLKPGQTVPVGDTGMSLSLLRFEPDFIRDEAGRVTSRGGELNNPAAQVEIRRDGETVLSGWIFARFPDFSMTHGAGSAAFSILFRDIRPGISPDYSIIEAARDKGVPLIWIGCGLLMAGLFLAFYWPPREVRLLVEGMKGRTEITAAAFGSKGREAVAAEFADLMSELKNKK